MEQQIKFLILNGSPRKDGNTYTINEAIKESILKMGQYNNEKSEFLEVNLRNIDIPMCRGCGTCFKLGEDKCPHSSIMQAIIERIEWCDCLIISSPVYSMQVSALLKNFLDHMSYNFRRPRYFNKKALIVSSSRGNDSKKSSIYLKDVVRGWGINDVYSLSIRCKNFDYELVDKDMKHIDSICERLYSDIKLKRHKKTSIRKIFKFNILRGIFNGKREEYNVDYKYCKDNGLNKKSYLKSIPISSVKKGIGNIVYKLAVRK